MKDGRGGINAYALRSPAPSIIVLSRIRRIIKRFKELAQAKLFADVGHTVVLVARPNLCARDAQALRKKREQKMRPENGFYASIICN